MGAISVDMIWYVDSMPLPIIKTNVWFNYRSINQRHYRDLNDLMWENVKKLGMGGRSKIVSFTNSEARDHGRGAVIQIEIFRMVFHRLQVNSCFQSVTSSSQ